MELWGNVCHHVGQKNKQQGKIDQLNCWKVIVSIADICHHRRWSIFSSRCPFFCTKTAKFWPILLRGYALFGVLWGGVSRWKSIRYDDVQFLIMRYSKVHLLDHQSCKYTMWHLANLLSRNPQCSLSNKFHFNFCHTSVLTWLWSHTWILIW